MPGSVFERLELPKILQQLRDQCTSAVGRDEVATVRFSPDIEEIRRWQEETTEAADLLRLHPEMSLGGLRDIRVPLARARKDGILEPKELLDVSDTLRCARRVKGFFSRIEEEYRHLGDYAGRIVLQEEIIRRIASVVSDEGEIYDSASPELGRLRREIAGLQAAVRARLESIIHSSELQKYLQEALVTLRGDRYVVPVKAESRSKIPGLVHDQSQSGATLFVEPFPVVELNNDLRRKSLQERDEVERILGELSAMVRDSADDIADSLSMLARIDFIMAKGKLSHLMRGCSPRLNHEGCLHFFRARHPLIARERVVPITVYLGRHFRILVITGPNTGGKTVALKTVGLLTTMVQCGLHIPADPESAAAVFDRIFVDVGDEQSIEQSLSTFSSHMSSIVELLPQVDSNTLVLLDELGAGTDPTEGSALAMAILEYLLERECRCVATTHYTELKAFAFSTPAVENASVEFDVKTLQPTYRLVVGVPGKSSAFDISSRLGLEDGIVRRAREYVNSDRAQFADLIDSLEENKRISFQERKEAEELRNRFQEENRRLEEKLAALEEHEREILLRANKKAGEIVVQAQQQTSELLEELKAGLTQEAEKAQARARSAAQNRLQKLGRELEAEVEKLAPRLPGRAPEKVEVGDRVNIPQLNQTGVVVSEPNSQNEVQVQVGPMKITVAVPDLRPAPESQPVAARPPKSGTAPLPAAAISAEIDLRGLSLEEALREVDRYLDRAFLAGLTHAVLIHGKGTGALRRGIHRFLEEHPQVKGFRDGGEGEGGLGVTIVHLQ